MSSSPTSLSPRYAKIVTVGGDWRGNLCYKAGHGPHPLAGSDGKKCGTCEGNTASFSLPPHP